jgi:prepilin-type N-terminal cleavage/methylation domain-containing protein
MKFSRETAIKDNFLRLHMKTTYSTRQFGFTLVELLVVISIIGILMALTLPAIQSAREAGRRTQCKNNLRNIIQAANGHLAAQTFYPSGGWGYIWSGDPDRGYGMTQPGSWLYNLLPYMEETALHDLGKGLPDAQRRAEGAKRVQTFVAGFKCASRQRPETIPYTIRSAYHFRNVAPPPATYTTSDYAGCGGDTFAISAGPGTDINTTLRKSNPSFVSRFGAGVDSNGIISVASEYKASAVRDGLSKTFFAGERFLYFSDYSTGSGSDDSGWTTGYDHDTIRWTQLAPNFDNTTDYSSSANISNFGSSHIGGLNMALCDGAVVTVPYEIDLQVYRQLGNRKDGLPENTTGLQ